VARGRCCGTFANSVKTIRLTIENRRKAEMLVFIEPEALDIWLKPGEICELVASKVEEDAHFELRQTEDGVTVFPSRGCGSISAFQNGCELACGHQRPANWG
jgi:hypothetical protein